MITLYNVVSMDGYIAGEDGNEDFIPEKLWPVTLGVVANYDVLVVGKNTYDTLQSYPKELLEPLEKRGVKKVVVTSDQHFVPKDGYGVVHALRDIPALADNALVISGPTLNTALFDAGMIDMMIRHEIPIVLGRGIRQFSVDVQSAFIRTSEKEIFDGIKEVMYKVGA
ncbi:MAG TPA: hypothetical protein VF857_11145 [Spirochaetota bacterium]